MKAVLFKNTGGPEVLQLVNDWSLPPRRPGQVKIKVASSSFNPVDSSVHRGNFGNPVLPKVPSGDVAGTVVERDDTSKFQLGDRVYALTTAFSGSNPVGAWAEFTYANEEDLALVPASLSLEAEAGAVPVVALTAYQALELAKANLKPGARVLVHAGAGGVGHIAVQLAKNVHQAYVVSTGRNVDLIKSLGADEVVDYTKEDFAARFKDAPFDVIIDSIGGETELKSYSVLKAGGAYVHIAQGKTSQERIAAGKQWVDRTYAVVFCHPSGQHLAELARLFDEGKLKIRVADIIPLEKAREAEEIAAKKSGGKILIQI